MPTRNISLTDHLDAVVENSVSSGEYQNASEVVRDALRLFEAQKREQALKLDRLRAAAKVGFDQLDNGDYIEIAEDQIGDYVADVRRRVDEYLKARR